MTDTCFVMEGCLLTKGVLEFMDFHMNNQWDDDDLWNHLDQTIEEILTEVDGMTTLGSKKQQFPTEQHRAGIHPRTKANEQNETATLPRHMDESHETNDLRRPQDEDEYWSISPTAWSTTSHARREMLSHVGHINETSEGEQAPDGDCDKCAEAGAECMVYRNLGNLSCSRCRFRTLTCSHQAVARPTMKKRKKTKREGIQR
jgi:hypothetical protein